MHLLFAGERVRGEWFNISTTLAEFVRRVCGVRLNSARVDVTASGSSGPARYISDQEKCEVFELKKYEALELAKQQDREAWTEAYSAVKSDISDGLWF